MNRADRNKAKLLERMDRVRDQVQRTELAAARARSKWSDVKLLLMENGNWLDWCEKEQYSPGITWEDVV